MAQGVQALGSRHRRFHDRPARWNFVRRLGRSAQTIGDVINLINNDPNNQGAGAVTASCLTKGTASF